jgi:hypothetical protein
MRIDLIICQCALPFLYEKSQGGITCGSGFLRFVLTCLDEGVTLISRTQAAAIKFDG